MNDRGMIKWQPFSSVAPSSYMVKDILKKKNKISKPILSNDQLEHLNKLIIECYYNQISLNIRYYKNASVNNIKGKIIKLDCSNSFIYMNNGLKLHFSQILSINT